jgi:hypothetical protein
MMAGIIATVSVLAAAAAADLLPAGFELSAPVFPKMLVLFQYEGSAFPATPAEAEAAAVQAALDFDNLLTSCAALYSEINLASDDTPLTREQIDQNYATVARCAYEQHTAKPYWIPGLVDEVDVCGLVLGDGWRLPMEADLATITASERQLLTETLQEAGEVSSWGTFYFNLRVFMRGSDGSLKTGDFSSTGSAAVSAVPDTCPPTTHCEQAIALRCLRAL